MSMASGADLSL